MALNTENKRRAAGLHHTTMVDPVADGDVGVEDRAMANWCYPDYFSGGVPPPSPDVSSFLNANQCIQFAFDPVLKAIRVHEVG